MVTFYKAQKKNTNIEKSIDFTCTDLDLHARGVGKVNGVTCFVEGVIPGEVARITPHKKGNIIEGELLRILTSSPQRKEPFCLIQNKCGGCPLYYLDEKQALQAKIEGIKKAFAKTTKYELGDPDFICSDTSKGYRRACRLSARSDHKKIILGFRENKSHSTITPKNCEILTKRLNVLIEPFNSLVNKLEAKKQVGHVELIDADNIAAACIRFTTIIKNKDKEILIDFAKELNIYLSILEPYVHEITKQEHIKETCIYSPQELFVTVNNIKLKLRPTSFLQVNKQVNEVMVQKALEYSNVTSEDKVLDLFCGLGNFTFPFAAKANSVVGVDVVEDMIKLANENAQSLGLNNTKFAIANLDEDIKAQVWTKEKYDLAILDPGRSGAYKATEYVAKMKTKRIIMVSCNPLAAARDCVLLKKAGYNLQKYAIFDMFPYTTHVEVMLVFTL